MKKINLFIQLTFRYCTRYTQKLIRRRGLFVRSPIFLFGSTIFLIILLYGIKTNFYSQTSVSQGVVGVYSQKNLPLVVTHLLSEPLVILDKSGRPQPNLVSGWQVNNNIDLYTFKLKDNLKWNDGSLVRSSDIKFDLPEVEVSYPDDKTIVFKLADPYSPFPTLLTSPVFKENSLIGVGQFRVTEITFNREFITKLYLTPVKNSSHQDLPFVSFRFYHDERTAKVAFELGEVESLIGLTEIEDLKSQPLVFFRKASNFNKVVAIFYNTEDPTLSDKNLRRALSYAAPKMEDEEIAKASIPPSSWAYNEQVKDQVGNLELTQKYLEKVQSGKNNQIILTTTPALSWVGERVIRSWKEVGISAILRVESGIPQNFQALLIAQSIPTDPDQYVLWHSTQTKTNITKYSAKCCPSSARVDKDLEDGRKVWDIEKRREKYLDFQKVLMEDAPATFLYFPKTQVIYRSRVEKVLNKLLPLQFL